MKSFIKTITLLASTGVLFSVIGRTVVAQEPQVPKSKDIETLPEPSGASPPETLRLTTRGEIPLSEFIDYISNRLGIRILYDESLRQKKVNLVAPDPIPMSSLDEILQSILINEGLIVTDADRQGFKRITTNSEIPRVARPSGRDELLNTIPSAVPVTRVFVLGEGLVGRFAELLQPLLSPQGGSIVPLERERLLVVTDIAKNVRRAEELLEILNGSESQVSIEFVPAENVAVDELVERLQSILDARKRAVGLGEKESGRLEISVDSRTNSLILVGIESEIRQAMSLLERLDQPLETEQKTFQLRYFSPERFDDAIRDILSRRPIKPPYQSRIEGNSLIVDSTPAMLSLVTRTQQQLDTREAPEAQNPVRFYKIKNVPAAELLETIRGIGANVTNSSGRTRIPPRGFGDTNRILDGFGPSTVGNGIISTGGVIPVTREGPVGGLLSPIGQLPGDDIDLDLQIENESQIAPDSTDFTSGFPTNLGGSDGGSEIVRQADVSVDIHTNTIIVVAPPEAQRIYASLIERLDERRPQVLIEAQIVIIDTSDDYTLGVEISGGDREGAMRLFSFSSYGLSAVDPTTGALSILPGVGFNGTLVDPDTADVVVRALSNHRRARVLSTPRILVNDNAEGRLTSVLEVPFTSVNASQTVATTSFAGFAEAGTTIIATPTISEDHYLQLDYNVTLNSFTGVGSDGVPPPRQTNEIQSRVTVPDGYTVIVGGLTSKNEAYEIDSIPILERIPIIRDLASLQTDNWSQTSLFVFLKPVILQDDKFKDLRYISDTSLTEAILPTNFPANEPLLID